MKVSQKLAILIKNLYLLKQYGARRLSSELPDKGRELGSIDSLLKRIHETGTLLPSYQAAADGIQRVAVDDLVLSLEDKPKMHRSAREISHETVIPVVLVFPEFLLAAAVQIPNFRFKMDVSSLQKFPGTDCHGEYNHVCTSSHIIDSHQSRITQHGVTQGL